MICLQQARGAEHTKRENDRRSVVISVRIEKITFFPNFILRGFSTPPAALKKSKCGDKFFSCAPMARYRLLPEYIIKNEYTLQL